MKKSCCCIQSILYVYIYYSMHMHMRRQECHRIVMTQVNICELQGMEIYFYHLYVWQHSI